MLLFFVGENRSALDLLEVSKSKIVFDDYRYLGLLGILRVFQTQPAGRSVQPFEKGASSPHHVWELSRTWLGDQNGLIAVLRVYMDESGTHDGSPVVTVGCYVATPKQWKLWIP